MLITFDPTGKRSISTAQSRPGNETNYESRSAHLQCPQLVLLSEELRLPGLLGPTRQLVLALLGGVQELQPPLSGQQLCHALEQVDRISRSPVAMHGLW